MVSTMPSAVRGFTKHEAASTEVVPSGRTRQCWAAMQRYCAYMAPPRMPTTLPRRACAASDVPAATTTPPPSFPAGIVRPMRPAAACIASGESIARTACAATRASRTIVLISARANMTPKSDGLMGAASIRTTTSSGPGAGRAASAKARVTVLSACTVEWSCQVWVGGIAIDPCRDGSERAHVHSVRVKRHGVLLAHAREAQPWHRAVALRRVWMALYGAAMQGARLSYAPAQTTWGWRCSWPAPRRRAPISHAWEAHCKASCGREHHEHRCVAVRYRSRVPLQIAAPKPRRPRRG